MCVHTYQSFDQVIFHHKTHCIECQCFQNGEALFAKLSKIDSTVSKDDYFGDGSWDMDGLSEDLKLTMEKVGSLLARLHACPPALVLKKHIIRAGLSKLPLYRFKLGIYLILLVVLVFWGLCGK